MGRPPKYRKEYAELAYYLTSTFGATREEIANGIHMGKKVAISTIYYWEKNHKEFLEAIKRGEKEFIEGDPDKLLHKKLYGFKKTAIKRRKTLSWKNGEIERDKNGDPVYITEYFDEEESEVPPDTNAIKFYLMNKFPDRFRNQINIDAMITTSQKEAAQLVGAYEDTLAWLLQRFDKETKAEVSEYFKKMLEEKREVYGITN